MNSPSTNPSSTPSFEPTPDPTTAPSTPFCQSIRLGIIDFDGFDSDDLNEDEKLQKQVANMTYHALAQTVLNANYDIEIDSFYVIYDDSLDANLCENGNVQQSVHIDETLCAFEAEDSNLLPEMIENEVQMINSIIAKTLAALYMKGQWSDRMEVSIAGPNEFRVSVKIVFAGPCR